MHSVLMFGTLIGKLTKVSHRATSVDPKPREARLELFLQPVVAPWQNGNLTLSLSSFHGFCELLGLGNIQRYVSDHKLHLVQDWSSHPLDDEGKLFQLQMQNASEVCPSRPR